MSIYSHTYTQKGVPWLVPCHISCCSSPSIVSNSIARCNWAPVSFSMTLKPLDIPSDPYLGSSIPLCVENINTRIVMEGQQYQGLHDIGHAMTLAMPWYWPSWDGTPKKLTCTGEQEWRDAHHTQRYEETIKLPPSLGKPPAPQARFSCVGMNTRCIGAAIAFAQAPIPLSRFVATVHTILPSFLACSKDVWWGTWQPSHA